MSPAKKRAMIERDHPELSISQQCKLVRLSRSAFYYTSVGINADTLAMMKEIDRVFTKYPFFGSRQIAAYLRREGTVVGRHCVRRLMTTMGLEAIYKRRRTSQPHPKHPVYQYLLRKWRKTAQTGSSAQILPSCQSRTASSTWWRSWIGPRARC